MKNALIIIALASVIAACNSNASSNSNAIQSAKKYRDSISLDSFKRAEAVTKEVDKREADAKIAALNEKVIALSTQNKQSSVRRSGSNSSSNYASQSSYTPAQPAKKGWSSAAKGAAIGAGAGAITGILVDKKDGRGAVIGGVVGAGTGYVIGRSADRKSGRVSR